MKATGKVFSGLMALCFVFVMIGFAMSPPRVVAGMPGFEVNKMSDMSDYYPSHPVIATGDVIKVAILAPFSGFAALNGEIYWCITNWVAHDINKRGGIMVAGKRRKVRFIKADTQQKPSVAKQIAEKMCLQEKVDFMWGTPGSNISLILQGVAKKYHKIYMNCASMSNSLMDGKHFNRYTFQTDWTVSQVGDTLAYYYSKQPENKFYILDQDYMFGHDLAEAFKAGLKKYKPDAQVVGEAYHPLFAYDYAPYLTKIKASGAQVIFSGDWPPDSGNLLKQSRQMGLMLPFANIFMDEPNSLAAVGPAGTVGLVHADMFMPSSAPGIERFFKKWNDQWKKWKSPYNTLLYKWPGNFIGGALMSTYWLMSVIERAGSADPEKIIKVWEGDEWKSLAGVWKMRSCDHRVVRDTFVAKYVYPNPWFKECANPGDEVVVVPAKYSLIPFPKDLARCKK